MRFLSLSIITFLNNRLMLLPSLQMFLTIIEYWGMENEVQQTSKALSYTSILNYTILDKFYKGNVILVSSQDDVGQ